MALIRRVGGRPAVKTLWPGYHWARTGLTGEAHVHGEPVAPIGWAVEHSANRPVAVGATKAEALALAQTRVFRAENAPRSFRTWAGPEPFPAVWFTGQKSRTPPRVDYWTVYATSSQKLAEDYGTSTLSFNWRDVPPHFIVGPDEDGIGGSIMAKDLTPPLPDAGGDWWVDYGESGLGAAMVQTHGWYSSFNIVLTGPVREMATLLVDYE